MARLEEHVEPSYSSLLPGHQRVHVVVAFDLDGILVAEVQVGELHRLKVDLEEGAGA